MSAYTWHKLVIQKMCAEMRIFMAKNSNYDYEETMVTLEEYLVLTVHTVVKMELTEIFI